MDYDFSGQEDISYIPESNVLGSFGDLSDNPDNKDKKKKETPYDLSGQDDLFPKSQQLIETPKSKITSKFGKRNDPFGAGIKFHNGVDIPMTMNTPINSLGRGTVVNLGDSGSKDYGRFVEIDYGGGLVLTYGHLNKIAVERGDRVSPEAILGLSGSTGRSKGPHLHIRAKLNGKSVNPEDYFGNMHDIAIGALSNDDVIKDKSYDFSGQDEINSVANINNDTVSTEFNFAGQDQIGEVKEIVETPYVDRRTFEEKIASGAASLSQPKITVPNPNQLLGNRITAIIPVKGVNKPDINTLTDSWLSTVDPSYSRINSEYRSMTGKNLIHFDGAPEYIGDNKYKLSARLTKGSVDLINAYIEGRNKGGPEAGWENAYHKSLEIKRQEQAVKEQVNKIREEDKNSFAKKHPYLVTALNIASPVSLLVIDNGQAAKAGISDVGTSDAQLIHNLRMLPEALYKLYRYGGDSEEYEALIERDREIQKNLFSYQSETNQPETLSGKVIAGAVAGVGAFPKFALAGSAGVAGLPTLVYIENLHRGNREAALSALPMALMGGVTHGFGEYLSSGTKVYLNTLDESSNPINKVIEVGRGLGNKAAFTRVKGELSLNPKAQSAFIAKDPVSIASFSPLERQTLMRGTNAFTNLIFGSVRINKEGGFDLNNPIDEATNFIVGLTFPVGKYKVGSFNEGKLVENSPVDSPANEQFLLDQSRISIPLTESPAFGEKQLSVVEQQQGNFPATETGFQAKGNGQTLFLNMDTAALNLLDLRRSLVDKSFIGTNNVGLKNSINRQIAIQKAIGVLESQIPKDVIDYFEQNENLVRSALKTNWEAVKLKEEYLGNKQTLKEIKTPDEIKVNDSIETKESAIDRLKRGLAIVKKNPELVKEASETVFGTNGSENKWVTPDKALFAYERLTNRIQEKGDFLKSEKGSFDPKAFSDLAIIAAFHLEDFYHRRIEPSFIELKNRFRITLGDTIKNVADEDLRNAYNRGNEILQSNIADPFFSRMKQDALERLPNKFTEEQARNILSQHKDEFEWTSGLSEFLESNKDKKINKQELIDIIQKGQIRVDESVAAENAPSEERKEFEAVASTMSKLDEQLSSKQISLEEYRNKYDLLLKRYNELTRLVDRSSQELRYSLRVYAGEKLELPGAKNSKEVKLISVFKEPINEGDVEGFQTPLKYQSAHWSEPNVVAHYRANDRVSTDNKRIYFGEEFQSDWNHDIREYGLKHNEKNVRNYAEQNVQERPSKYIKNQATEFFVQAPSAERFYEALGATKEQAVESYIKHLLENRKGIEPNPFMQHNWKELVLKRFLRDAVIAKDESGNYKYDAIGWTTARQQLERYGGILEGKDFTWEKNTDGTYTFRIKTLQLQTHQTVHELTRISLERFAELTTKEAADFVREQENHLAKIDPELTTPAGQFSLSEPVELRSREGTYADYDVAYKNILSKIGKRFGAKYSEREIETDLNDNAAAIEYNRETTLYDVKGNDGRILSSHKEMIDAEDARSVALHNRKKEKVHSLEITPSMHESLSKEGLPLYGTGGSDALKASEFGIRNKIITTDVFNEARNDLVKKLPVDNKGITFNSGLNPDAFIDQVKLLYSGIKDLAEFTNKLVERYGEPIRQFVEDFYFSVKNKAEEFNKKLDIKIEDWQSNLNKLADNPAWQIRNTEKSERGSFSLRKKDTPELKDYYSDKTKHQIAIGLDYRAWMRGIALSQISTEFGKVYDTLRLAQRVVHGYESNILNQLMFAKKIKKAGLDHAAAEAIYEGNETQKVFTDPELTTRGLSSQQIDAYRNVRAAVDNVLNLRLEGKLYAVREKANKLNEKLLLAIPGSQEELSLKTQLLDLADAETKMKTYYQKLKDEGYITIQRRGKVAAFLEDPNYPIGDPKRKIYNQFNSAKEANDWVQRQKTALRIPKLINAGSIYDIRNLKEIALKEKLTPSQFEDLVDRSGASSTDPQIEKIRSEVYSKFPSFTYQLDREFIRGYDRNLQTAIDSTVHQAELYSSSFYSKVGSEEGMKALEATGLDKSDPNLYKIASQYIKDETSPGEMNWLSKKAIQARRLTYLWQLGFDVNQLYLNAVAQPITQTYGYFSRIEYNEIKLSGLEPEHYFIKAGKLAAKGGDPNFDAIKTQLVVEHVLAPEFTKTLIESKTGTGKTSKVEHWASVFMRVGEKATRTHAAAEAYLIGKEKFSLTGDDLIKFIVKAVDATQSNPTRGENPYVIRQLGESGKLVYQFLAFNQMWWENLAIGIKDSKGTASKSLFAVREFAPLAVIGGLSGLPLSAFAGTMYTLLTGRDPKKDADKFLGDNTFIEQLARYGITTSAALSQKLTPTAPILDQTGRMLTADTSGGIGTLADSIPAFATADQLIRGANQIYSGKTLKGIANLSPRFIKGPVKTIEASKRGFKTTSGDTLLPKRKTTKLQLVGQALNISPTPVIEKYDRERTKKLKKNKVFKKLRKAL